MWREVVGFGLLVGCSTPSPAPMLGEDPVVLHDVSVVPAVESPDDAVRDTSAIDTPRAPAATVSIDRAVDPFRMAAPNPPVCASPAIACAKGCRPITGMKRDDANGCYADVVVGCSGATSVNLAATCAMREDDGVIFLGPTTFLDELGSGWGGCPADDPFYTGAERPMCAARNASLR